MILLAVEIFKERRGVGGENTFLRSSESLIGDCINIRCCNTTSSRYIKANLSSISWHLTLRQQFSVKHPIGYEPANRNTS